MLTAFLWKEVSSFRKAPLLGAKDNWDNTVMCRVFRGAFLKSANSSYSPNAWNVNREGNLNNNNTSNTGNGARAVVFL